MMFRRFVRILVLATALLFASGLSVSRAWAGYIATLTQQGSDVVAHGAGIIDLTGLSFVSSGNAAAGMLPAFGAFNIGPADVTNADEYSGVTGPSSFGLFRGSIASSGSGDILVINPTELFVPQGYVSGDALSSISTYNNETLSSLRVIPGTYRWTWGTGANQNFTLKIGAAAVPETGSAMMLFSGALCALAAFRRKIAGPGRG